MLLYIILVLQFYCIMCAKLDFTNINCTSNDINFAGIDYCFVKAVNRTFRYFSLKVNLHEPLTDIWVNVDIRKRANGYRPFLYNVTFDLCKLLRGRNKNPLYNFLFNFIAEPSNINHTCPYVDSIIVEKLSTDRVLTLLHDLPWPSGEYGVFTTWIIHKVVRATVNVFGKLY